MSDQERIAPTYLEKAVYLLEAQGYDVVSSLGDAGGGIEVDLPQRYPVLADMLQRNHVGSCAVFRRDLWVDAGERMTGNEPEIIDDDWRFWLRLSALGARIVNLLDEPMILVERQRTFVSGDGSRAATAERRRFAIEPNRDVLGEYAMQLSERRRTLALRVDQPLINLEGGFRSDAKTILTGLPFLVLGGAERLLSGLAVHLARRGFRLIVVTTDPVYEELGDATAWFEVATAEIYQLPRFLERARWPEFIHYLFATRRIDLLWLVGSRLFYELLPELRVAHTQLRVLDLLFNTVGHTASNRQFARHIDRILVESREVAEWLFAAGETCERVQQIESGVDCDVYRPRQRTPEMLQRLGVSPDAFVIGYSGRLAEEKDPDAFLEIADLCRAESQLTFVMTGTGPLAEQVERRARSLDLGDRFRFLGAVADVRDAMAAYDVLVLPSRFDGRPQAVLESLALGVPVVASRVGGLPEIVQEGRTGFLCGPRDVQAFAERIRWLAAHREEHRGMRAAARDYAVRHLSARRMYEEYEEAVRNVLSR